MNFNVHQGVDETYNFLDSLTTQLSEVLDNISNHLNGQYYLHSF